MKSEKRIMWDLEKGGEEEEEDETTHIGPEKTWCLLTGFWYDYKDVLMPVHQLQCQTMLLFLDFVLLCMHAKHFIHIVFGVVVAVVIWLNGCNEESIYLQGKIIPKPSIIHTEWIAFEPITITFAIIVCLFAHPICSFVFLHLVVFYVIIELIERGREQKRQIEKYREKESRGKLRVLKMLVSISNDIWL